MHKKQPETRKQVSQAIQSVYGRRFNGVKTERNRVDKQKSLNKKKQEDVQVKKLIAAPCEAI